MSLSREHFEEVRQDETERNAAYEYFEKMESAPIQLRKVILPTKSGAEALSEALIDEVVKGEVNAIETGVKIKWLQEVLDRVYKGISETIRSEAEKHGKEGAEFNGARVELAEVGVKYNYSNDPVWSRIAAKIEPLETERKQREDFLKTIKHPMDIIDSDTGEVITVPVPVKESKSSIKITLGK